MATVRVDNGEPFVAGIPDHDGLVLHPQLCASLACNAQHVRARRLRRVESKGVEIGPWLSLEFDEASGAIAPTDDETRGLIAEMPWLADWVRENRGPLENRFVRLRGLRDSPDGRADVAPDWRPGELISYLHLFPHETTPMLETDSATWAVVDAYCPHPSCNCDQVDIDLVDGAGHRLSVGGQLGANQPGRLLVEPGPVEHALWRAIHDDEELVERLRVRQAEVRGMGSFILARHDERARLSTPPSKREDTIGEGYLEHDRLTHAAVGRMLGAASVFAGARPMGLADVVIRAALDGAIQYRGDAVVEHLPDIGLSLTLRPDRDAGVGVREIVLFLVARHEAPLACRAQRIAHGWPLADGQLLPLVDAYVVDDEEKTDDYDTPRSPPTATELAIVTVIAEAIGRTALTLRAACDGPDAHEERLTVELPAEAAGPATAAGAVNVVLTLAAVEIDGEGETELDADLDEPIAVGADEIDDGPDDDDGALDEDEDKDQEAGDEEHDPRAELRAAAVDWALHKGQSLADAALVEIVATELDEVLKREGGPDEDRWTPSVFSTLLRDHGPRSVQWRDDQIDRVPAAATTIVEFLVAAGYEDGEDLADAVRRSTRTFLDRARDPSRFSPAKALFVGMRAAGVDVFDQQQVDAYLAKKNADGRRGTAGRGRWSRGANDPLPADGDACPCGSGKRWKKCCKPR